MVDLSMKLKENARNVMLVLAYDGGRYHGFQRQKNAISVQNILEQKLAVLFGHTIELAASGRTDAGVHAYGQVVNFFTIGTIPIDRVVKAINSLLPDDIVVQKAREMDMEFSARHSAKDKTYIYRVQQGELLDPFLRSYTWFVKKSLNIDLMNQALAMLVGEHDFSAFQAAGSAPMHPVRTIYRADCEKQNNEIIFTFWGNGFLYHMVRNIVGTIVNVGLEKTSIEKFREIFYSKDRKKSGATAPAQGLYLKEVNY